MNKVKLAVAGLLLAVVMISASGCILLGALAGTAATAYGIYSAVSKK